MIQNTYIKDFVNTIKTSDKIKIIISNKKNNKLKIVFNSNYFIEIPDNSWFANGLYNELKKKLSEILDIYNDAVIIIAGGLASKVLISEITDIYKKVSFIDTGSAFDLLVQKQSTRSWQYDENNNSLNYYNTLIEYFKDYKINGLPNNIIRDIINNINIIC